MVAKGIADVQSGKIKEIRDAIGMETNEFNPYRKRLIRKMSKTWSKNMLPLLLH